MGGYRKRRGQSPERGGRRREGRDETADRQALDQSEIGFFADLQRLLYRKKVPLSKRISRICAVDAAYGGDRVVAVASVFEEGRLVEESACVGSCSLPYVSGLFFLREGPFVVEAIRRLKVLPQLLCFDAHGAAHPRSAGLATVCGMVLGIPSIGIAKSLLLGKVVSGGGGVGRIVSDGRTVGLAVRTNGVIRYWSSGYSVGLGELKSVIRRHAAVCLRAMAESHEAAKEQVRAIVS